MVQSYSLGRIFAVSLTLAACCVGLPVHAQYGGEDPQNGLTQAEYNQLADQAMALSKKGDNTQAINLMTQAFQMAPGSKSIVNNLAYLYIQRGVNLMNVKRDYGASLDDHRKALFYLLYQWPMGVPKTPSLEQNVAVVKGNMTSLYKALQVNPADSAWHLKTAQALRLKGQLPQAMVEYGWSLETNAKQSTAWTAQGDIFMVFQQPERARIAYQKAIESTASPADTAWVKLGTAQLKAGLPEKAAESFDKALAVNSQNKDALLALEQLWQNEIKANPRNFSAHLNLGAVYQQMKRYPEAFAEYQVADRLSPGNSVVRFNMASLYQAQGNTEQAANIYESILQQNPNDVRVMTLKAELLESQKKWGEAEALLLRALQLSPDKKAVFDPLVDLYQKSGETPKLLSTLDKYAATYPQDPAVQYQTALAFHDAKQFDKSIDYYQKTLALNPNLADAHANLGTALHAVNRDTEATAALEKALKLDPALGDVKTLLQAIRRGDSEQALSEAVALQNAGDSQAAVAKYEQLLKADPKNPQILTRYGLALYALKRYAEAAKAYDVALAGDPNNAQIFYYKGLVYDEQNRVAEAMSLYQKALAINPNLKEVQEALTAVQQASTDVYLSEAMTAYEQKAFAKALVSIDQALKADPQNATAYYTRGLVYDAQQKPEPARIAYQKATELKSDYIDAFYALAVVLDTQGKAPQAKQAYARFLELTQSQPEDEFIKYARERVSAL